MFLLLTAVALILFFLFFASSVYGLPWSLIAEGPPMTFSPRFQLSPSRFSAPSSTLLVSRLDRNGVRSLGESIRIHRPFIFNSAAVATGPSTVLNNHTLVCMTYDKRLQVPAPKCRKYLNAQVWDGTGLDYGKVLANSKHATRDDLRCTNTTTVVINIMWRDMNVCHYLMKMLLAFAVMQRAQHDPDWLSVPPVSTVVLVSNRRDIFQAIRPGKEETFHIGLQRVLFTSKGVDVIATRSLTALKYRSSLCFQAGVIVGSFANRFAFPDIQLGATAGYNDTASLRAPFGSDALALQGPPLVFHAFSRAFSSRGEAVMRAMLRDVAKEEGVDLYVFEHRRPAALFWEQVGAFADASVIVGFHGAGLSLGVFAPRGAALVEIEPDYHQLDLFGRLETGGMDYERLILSKGTSEKWGYTSNLVESDCKRLKRAIRDSVRKRKKRIARMEVPFNGTAEIAVQ
eukprot:IDg10403t1